MQVWRLSGIEKFKRNRQNFCLYSIRSVILNQKRFKNRSGKIQLAVLVRGVDGVLISLSVATEPVGG